MAVVIKKHLESQWKWKNWSTYYVIGVNNDKNPPPPSKLPSQLKIPPFSYLTTNSPSQKFFWSRSINWTFVSDLLFQKGQISASDPPNFCDPHTLKALYLWVIAKKFIKKCFKFMTTNFSENSSIAPEKNYTEFSRKLNFCGGPNPLSKPRLSCQYVRLSDI